MKSILTVAAALMVAILTVAALMTAMRTAGSAYAENFDDVLYRRGDVAAWCFNTPTQQMSANDVAQCINLGKVADAIQKGVEKEGAIKVMRGGEVEYVSPKR